MLCCRPLAIRYAAELARCGTRSRREPPTEIERTARDMQERGRSKARIPLNPEGPARGGGGFER